MIDVQTRRGRETEPSTDDLLNEAVAIGVLLLALLILLALISDSSGSNLIGRIGMIISDGLTFAVGKYVAYIVPAMVLATGVLVWRGSGVTRGGLRIIGLYGTLASV